MSDRTPLYEVAEKAGAVFGEESGWLVPRHFADLNGEYRTACRQAAIFDLSHRGKIELTGPEARSFLHNLCTNDILHLPPGKGCEAFFATVKAKVVAHAFIYYTTSVSEESSLWLDVAPAATEKLVKHLNHHLISEQVEINDRTKGIAQLHLAGPESGAALQKLMGQPIAEMVELTVRQDLVGPLAQCHLRRQNRLGIPGYDILCPTQQAAGLWQALVQSGAVPAGADAYEMLRIEAGLPEFGKDFDENYLVMELGRTQQAISYTKGCYLGQEPVVRSRDLGHVNRTLLGLKVRGEKPARPGAKLFRDTSEVGQVASSIFSPRLETAIALAYVRRGSQEPGTQVEIDAGSGRVAAEVASLPLVT